MGTVRNTAVAAAPMKKGGKRKIVNVRRPLPLTADAEDLSIAHAIAEDMLDQKLASRDKWQICTQRNLSEIRAECMKVRRQLLRLEESMDSVQMQVEDGLSGYEHRREELQQFMGECRDRMERYTSQADAAQQQMTEHKENTQRQLVKINKRVEKYAEKLQGFASTVDEDTLLTQLTGLQERYDHDLTAAKEEMNAQVEHKIRVAMEEMQRTIAGVQEGARRRERDEEDNTNRLQATSNQVRADMDSLVRRVAELEHHSGFLIAENTQLKQQVESSRKLFSAVDERLVILARDVERQARFPPPPTQFDAPRPPLPPPVNLGHLEDKLYYMQRDVSVMAEDYSHWKSHADASQQRLRQELAARIDETRDAMFKALNHDSGTHEYENRRLRDACFDIRADVNEMRKEMIKTRSQLQMEMQAKWTALAEMQRPRPRSRSRSPPREGRSFRRLPPPRNEDEESHYSYYGSGHDERRSSHSRRRSRSRSQSPIPGLRPSTMQYVPLNRPGRVESPPLPTNDLVSPPLTRPPPHRQRRQRTAHEIIVIEEEDDDDHMQEGEATRTESVPTPGAPPSPDRLMDGVDRDENTEPPSTSDHESEAATAVIPATADDLRLGSLLYACFGGAPTLDSEWIANFPTLHARDQVGADELARFLRLHAALVSFPPPLAHFVSQSIDARLENKPRVRVKTDPPTTAAIASAFASVVATIRHMWNEQLCTSLEALVGQCATETGQDPAQFRVALPVASSSPPSQSYAALLDKYRVWARSQNHTLSFLLWRLKRCRQPSWTNLGTRETSPSVFLFLCLFDAVHVDERATLRGRYRLSATGKKVVSELWVHVMDKLPPFFFVECSWLDAQASQPTQLPLLGIAHVLSVILFGQSRLVHELSPSEVSNVIAHSVRLLQSMLLVDGYRGVASVVLDAAHELLLELPDLQWVHMIGLGNDFFNVIRQVPH